MDSPAHRRVRAATDQEPLSASGRAELRWGLERVLLMHEDDDGHDLARTLQRALRHLPVVMLHDRLLPDGLLVEHLAVGPGGVTVVASWSAGDIPSPLTVERVRGMFSAHGELLRDGALGDRTALVGPVRDRVAAIRALIEEMAPVEGALWLDGEVVPRLHPLVVEGVVVAGPKAIAALTARDGDLQDYELTALVDFLDGALPPAL
jgi:hypothetical protein